MAKPDFLCIGAQKAGTTWLDVMFRSHEDIWTPPVKELQYFNELYMPHAFKWTKEHRAQHGEKAKFWESKKENPNPSFYELADHIANGNISKDWYEKIFDYAPPGSIKGEMTPEYSLLSEHDVKKIAKEYPDLKIIFVMRDPVERALSGIKMRLKQQGFDEHSSQKDIDNFVIKAASDWDVIERSNYEKIIKTWAKFFSKDSILLLHSSNLKNYPDKTLKDISRFFDIKEEKFKGDKKSQIHTGKHFKIGENALKSISENQNKNKSWYDDNFFQRAK